jgi:hypothetical protein
MFFVFFSLWVLQLVEAKFILRALCAHRSGKCGEAKQD